ncbi:MULTISPECIES: glycosyltransferase [unclassified Mucilaginibacter]|uniref:glycosyltransferase n=1 Tax=unclassified Mucilaginibacter TaxID=2617802 RepID=UPI002AC8C600|nr:MULTISPECIES: glycosyltransferase [unclassified Mucilaginibacter]MEB0262953.1 glycosyltransferase [Mucilaginibacter sp. 10I4]MEB0277552.1 glycosyltransferase [Mucilaginibacter sp. 10B2]MEB0299467.1 glycosyltransferase [Mucilaginibacter sp. 5C4]WPX24819.1 glycosyltransferase [Mucilaginibacter sp. 5C4]
MSKKVLFLTGLFPSEIREEIVSNSKFNIQFAADALQWSFVKGLGTYYDDLTVLNFPFVGSYPILYKVPIIKRIAFGSMSGFTGINPGYFNLIGLKNIDIYLSAKREIKKWALNTKGEKVIIVYSAFLPFLKAAINSKELFNELKVVLILPDLPQFMGGPNNVFYRIFKNYTYNALQKLFKKTDGYILLTPYMMEKLPEKKPFTVIEGIFDNVDISSTATANDLVIKTILYTGTLARRYGILNLLAAFNVLENITARLIICGDGDAKDEIKAAAENNPNIIYNGSLERLQVLQLQTQASLLVNPRTAEGEFTRYSFPSKTMEYLASGVPVLIYKLPGIPEEYYEHCYSLDGVSIKTLSDKIKCILQMDSKTLIEKGKKARDFILNYKNPVAQCKKIVDLIENKI